MRSVNTGISFRHYEQTALTHFSLFNSRFIPLKKKIKTNGNNEEFYYFKKCLQTRENEIIQPLNLTVDDRYS